VVNTASNTITGTIAVGDLPNGVAVTPDGTTAYVANIDSDTVSMISNATGTVTATIPASDQARAQLLRAERIAAEHGLPHVRHDARSALHSVR
jgi:YVTN family beta-propeller protein